MAQLADAETMAALNGAPSRLIVSFFMEACHNEEKSKEAGRPIYDDCEFVEIRMPGDKDEIRRRGVRPSDKLQFPQQYAAFKAGADQPCSGTPLAALPFLTKSQVLEFQAAHCTTAEHVRDMPDSVAQRFMGAHGIRQRIAAFLAAAEGAAPAERLASELSKRDQQIEVQKHALDKQGEELAALRAQVEVLAKSKR
jgi:hypothetical protein